ncbi:MAG: SDR family oxidoreductase [Bacteroidota bacterium]
MAVEYFRNKVIWITGASSGIGEAFARALYANGAFLILSSRREEALNKVKEQLGGDADRIAVLPLDLTESDSIPQKSAIAASFFGPIDMLFSNGGVSQRSTVLDSELSTLRDLMEVNYFGSVSIAKAVLPDMVARKQGHIIVTSSVAGKIGTKFRSGYAGSKHAIHGFFDSLRQEMYKHNVAVTLLCPGFIKTNISVNALTADGTPFGKMGDAHVDAMTADEMVHLVLPKIARRKEEIFVTGIKERMAMLVKRISPSLLNRILKNQKVT